MALKWSDVDLVAKIATVTRIIVRRARAGDGTLANLRPARSRRTVPLPETEAEP